MISIEVYRDGRWQRVPVKVIPRADGGLHDGVTQRATAGGAK